MSWNNFIATAGHNNTFLLALTLWRERILWTLYFPGSAPSDAERLDGIPTPERGNEHMPLLAPTLQRGRYFGRSASLVLRLATRSV